MKRVILGLALVFSSVVFAAASPVSSGKLADGREILVAASNNLTLYIFDVDQGSTSKCYNACANAWPPLTVPKGTAVTAPLGLTDRTDGTVQVTVDGKPVYFFAGDQEPGDINGDGLQGVWHIITK